jgi:hypothetical protein
MTLRITVVNEETGETSTETIPQGEYLLTTAEPCYLAHVQVHGNGTHVLTIKGRTQP